jgi:hypothetical protein
MKLGTRRDRPKTMCDVRVSHFVTDGSETVGIGKDGSGTKFSLFYNGFRHSSSRRNRTRRWLDLRVACR